MLEELRGDVQATLAELRELAHGIYPPLLRDRGLAEALRTAANRAVLPTEVDRRGDRALPERDRGGGLLLLPRGDAERRQARRRGRVDHGDGHRRRRPAPRLRGRATTAPGFDPRSRSDGHGFVNMRDRLGAVGGTLTVDSDCEPGTRIGGHIPLDHAAARAQPPSTTRSSSAPGPNGLVAAVTLARAGWRVLVVEAQADARAAGTRSAELTLPGVVHDVCSAIHPLALGSPALRDLPLGRPRPRVGASRRPARPPARRRPAPRCSHRSVDETARGLGRRRRRVPRG